MILYNAILEYIKEIGSDVIAKDLLVNQMNFICTLLNDIQNISGDVLYYKEKYESEANIQINYIEEIASLSDVITQFHYDNKVSNKSKKNIEREKLELIKKNNHLNALLIANKKEIDKLNGELLLLTNYLQKNIETKPKEISELESYSNKCSDKSLILFENEIININNCIKAKLKKYISTSIYLHDGCNKILKKYIYEPIKIYCIKRERLKLFYNSTSTILDKELRRMKSCFNNTVNIKNVVESLQIYLLDVIDVRDEKILSCDFENVAILKDSYLESENEYDALLYIIEENTLLSLENSKLIDRLSKYENFSISEEQSNLLNKYITINKELY